MSEERGWRGREMQKRMFKHLKNRNSFGQIPGKKATFYKTFLEFFPRPNFQRFENFLFHEHFFPENPFGELISKICLI